jgi:hypothetical protein
MNRPTFITMSTLVFTIVAYVALAQMTPGNSALVSHQSYSATVALESLHVHGR